MDSFYVPYMKGTEDLFMAISRMADIKSTGVVVNNNGNHHLFTSKTVFEFYNANKDEHLCSALPASEGFAIADLSSFIFNPETWMDNMRKYSSYFFDNLFEDILTGMNLNFGFLYPEKILRLPQIVQVITLHETDKHDNFDPVNTICVCNSSNRHVVYDGSKDGKDCDYDPPHTYKCTSSNN